MVSPYSPEWMKKKRPITIGVTSQSADDGEKPIHKPIPAKINEELRLSIAACTKGPPC